MKRCIILLIAFFSCAQIIAAPDTTRAKEIIIIFDGKGSSPVLRSESSTREIINDSDEIISLPSEEKEEKNNEVSADTTRDQFIITHEYQKAEPDTSISDMPVKKGKPREEWYVTVGKALLVAAMGFVGINAAGMAIGGIVAIIVGIIWLSSGSMYALAGSFFLLIGLIGIALGVVLILGILKLLKLPFFDSVLRRGRPAKSKSKKEEKPQIFN